MPQQENIDKENNKYQSTLTSFNEEAPTGHSYCHNCNQSQNRTLIGSYGNDSPYFTSFLTHYTLYVYRQTTFKFVSSTANEANADEIALCHACSHHLLIESDYKAANKNIIVWPSYIWYLFNNNDV